MRLEIAEASQKMARAAVNYPAPIAKCLMDPTSAWRRRPCSFSGPGLAGMGRELFRPLYVIFWWMLGVDVTSELTRRDRVARGTGPIAV